MFNHTFFISCASLTLAQKEWLNFRGPFLCERIATVACVCMPMCGSKQIMTVRSTKYIDLKTIGDCIFGEETQPSLLYFELQLMHTNHPCRRCRFPNLFNPPFITTVFLHIL
jgi:hypothetical protein